MRCEAKSASEREKETKQALAYKREREAIYRGSLINSDRSVQLPDRKVTGDESDRSGHQEVGHREEEPDLEREEQRSALV